MEEVSKGGCLVQTKMLIPLALLWVWRAAGCSQHGLPEIKRCWQSWSAPSQLLLLPPKPSCNYHTRARQLPGRVGAKIRQKPCPCQPGRAVSPPVP